MLNGLNLAGVVSSLGISYASNTTMVTLYERTTASLRATATGLAAFTPLREGAIGAVFGAFEYVALLRREASTAFHSTVFRGIVYTVTGLCTLEAGRRAITPRGPFTFLAVNRTLERSA